jgi:hypothetical protein
VGAALFFLLGLLISIACYFYAASYIPKGFASVFKTRRARLLSQWLPTVKTKGVFIGTVELNGTAECEVGRAIKAPMSGRLCVYLETSIEEERLEKDGGKAAYVWHSIKKEAGPSCFYLRDETGAVRIDCRGAEMEKQKLYSKTFHRSHPKFSELAGGVPEAPNSTGRRRFKECGIPLHSDIYVWGRARVRSDAVAAEIAADPEIEPLFWIAKSEQSARELAWAKEFATKIGTGCCCFFVVGAPLGLGIAAALRRDDPALLFLAFVVVYVPILLGGLAITFVNAALELRRRVDQAKANVDVELKRRADLIPALAQAAREAARHERAVLEMLAALRSQQEIWRVDDAETKRASALAPLLLALGEKYPELGSNKTFAYLRQGVVDAEDRVALAREFYNNIVEAYETLRKKFPHCLIAALWRWPEANFFNAEGFEAKTIDVELENVNDETNPFTKRTNEERERLTTRRRDETSNECRERRQALRRATTQATPNAEKRR